MSEPEREGKDSGSPADIRTDIPHPARVYDYWLGGTDNFPADREMAEWVLTVTPETLDTVRANRQWMVRAIRVLCDAGIRQFLDIGAGLPTSPNTYEVAQSAAPEARVVYVDNDPLVLLHAEAPTAEGGTTHVVRADMRNVAEVLAGAGELLDFTKPVALMFVGCLHHLAGSDDPAGRRRAVPYGTRTGKLPHPVSRNRRIRPGTDAPGIVGSGAARRRLDPPREG